MINYNYKINAFIKIGFILFVGIICSCNPKQESQKTDPENISKPLDSLVIQLIDNGDLIGSELLILKDGKVVFNKAYGYRTLAKNNPVQIDDIWAVKSMTKPFTATAILMLRDEGLLTLDDPLTKYIPEYAGYKQTTIKNLLIQNSGDDYSFGNGGYNVYDFDSQEKWVLAWAKEKANGEFGQYQYSTFNYEALGYIVAQVSGQSVEQYITNTIIHPLNLNDTYTYFSPDSSWSDRVPDRFRSNNKPSQYDTLWTNKEPQPWRFFPSSLGLWMSAKDYGTFIQMWMNNGKYNDKQILKESTVEEALQIRVKIMEGEDFGHGYGWIIESAPMFFNYGGADGSFGLAFPQENITLVFTTHMQDGSHKNKIWDLLGSVLFKWDD